MPDSPLFRNPAVPLTEDQIHLRKLTFKTIVAFPDDFCMNDWERKFEGGGQCRTTRCIAGWAQYLARGAVYEHGDITQGIPPVDEDAIELLGITVDEYGSDDVNDVNDEDDDKAVERMRLLAGE